MTCRKVVKELPAYLASELSEKARSRVEAHLKHCALCTAELRALEQTDHVLDTLQPIEPRRDLVGAVVHRIECEQATISPFRRFLTSLSERQLQLQHAAAVLLLVAALGLMMYRTYWRPRIAIVPTKVPVVTPRIDAGPAGSPDLLTDADPEGKWGFLVPLSAGDVEQINDEMRRAKDRVDAPSPASTPSSEVIPVDAVIIEPGPDGSLLIKPSEGGAPSAIGDSGESGSAE